MLKSLLNKLEDDQKSFLGPNIKSLKFWGLLLPKERQMKYFYMFMHMSYLVFVVTEYVEIFFIKNDLSFVLSNLKISMLATVNVFKVTTFLYLQKLWKSIIEYVTKANLAQRNTDDPIKKGIIKKYTDYSRFVTYFYWTLTYFTIVTLIMQPFIKLLSAQFRYKINNGAEPYPLILSSWVPVDKNTLVGYFLAFAYQMFACVHGAAWVSSYDMNSIAIMVFIRGELELISYDCAEIFGNKYSVKDEDADRRIKEYHTRVVELNKYVKLLNSCLSPIMTLYILVCSVMLCVTVFQIKIETSSAQKVMVLEYLIFGIVQLFLYCWHSNEVLYMSRDLMRGPYESKWYKATRSKRKDIILLTGAMQKTITFHAGPFTDLNVATFIYILKGAYSYYTILNK